MRNNNIIVTTVQIEAGLPVPFDLRLDATASSWLVPSEMKLLNRTGADVEILPLTEEEYAAYLAAPAAFKFIEVPASTGYSDSDLRKSTRLIVKKGATGTAVLDLRIDFMHYRRR